MIKILKQNQAYTLLLEKVGSELWLEVIERHSGMAWILIHKRGFGHTAKGIEKSYADTPLNKIVSLFQRTLEPAKVYKTGAY